LGCVHIHGGYLCAKAGIAIDSSISRLLVDIRLESRHPSAATVLGHLGEETTEGSADHERPDHDYEQ
jgi:hypothetical protein